MQHHVMVVNDSMRVVTVPLYIQNFHPAASATKLAATLVPSPSLTSLLALIASATGSLHAVFTTAPSGLALHHRCLLSACIGAMATTEGFQDAAPVAPADLVSEVGWSTT